MVSVVEDVAVRGGVRVAYRQLVGGSSRRHAVVIFSGFRPAGSPYDFAVANAERLGCDVLWIRDDFDGAPGYYLRRGGRADVERAVEEFLVDWLGERGLGCGDVTFAGFSKGGTAALYFGLKLGAANVLSTVPQFGVGTYVAQFWPDVLRHMTATGSVAEVQELDRILPEMVREKSTSAVNVYLISSSADATHSTETGSQLESLRKLGNFHLLMTEWPEIKEHVDVTPQNRGLIVALLTQFVDGFHPAFGEVVVGADVTTKDALEGQWRRGERVGVLSSLEVRDGRLFIEGAAFRLGRQASAVSVGPHSVVLTDDAGNQDRLALDSRPDADLNSRFAAASGCDYSDGGFSSSPRGIDLSHVPVGSYELSVERMVDGAVEEFGFGVLDCGVGSTTMADRRAFVLRRKGTRVFIDVCSLLAPEAEDDAVWNFDDLRSEGGRLFLAGRFAVPGMEVRNWGDAYYFVTLISASHVYGFPLGLLHRPDGDLPIPEAAAYCKAYFSTLKGAGVDLKDVVAGTYDVVVTIQQAGRSSSIAAPSRLVVPQGDKTESSDGSTKRVAIFGSCVTRDNFNSRLAPRWREKFDVGPVLYQASFLSAFWSPVAVPPGGFADLDEHSRQCVIAEFEKRFLWQLVEYRPDVVLIDFFADARFDVLQLDNSFVTDNSWKFATSADAAQYASAPRHGLGVDPERFLQLWRGAARGFAQFMAERLPETLIVVNAARAVEDVVGGAPFARSDVQEFNAKWRYLEQAFLEEVTEAVVLDPMVEGVSADATHPWGRYWVHYESRYYEEFARRMAGVVGLPEEVVVEPRLVPRPQLINR